MGIRYVGVQAPPTKDTIVAGLKTLREGDYAAQQPIAFVKIMFHAGLYGLITAQGARFFLTPEGRAFIREAVSSSPCRPASQSTG
jgi:hypothetical protein